MRVGRPGDLCGNSRARGTVRLSVIRRGIRRRILGRSPFQPVARLVLEGTGGLGGEKPFGRVPLQEHILGGIIHTQTCRPIGLLGDSCNRNNRNGEHCVGKLGAIDTVRRFQITKLQIRVSLWYNGIITFRYLQEFAPRSIRAARCRGYRRRHEGDIGIKGLVAHLAQYHQRNRSRLGRIPPQENSIRHGQESHAQVNQGSRFHKVVHAFRNACLLDLHAGARGFRGHFGQQSHLLAELFQTGVQSLGAQIASHRLALAFIFLHSYQGVQICFGFGKVGVSQLRERNGHRRGSAVFRGGIRVDIG
eukprot:scaffold8005_cov275-Amphora_coffeaeformis.AAC.22